MTLRGLLVASFLAAAALAAPAGAQETTLHREQSLYRNIYITQDGDERCMLFRARRGLGRESCKMMHDPDKLVFEYAPMMLSSLYLNPSPKRVLIIGLGGGTLPTALQQLLPAADIDVVELDDAVYRLAQRYFDFKPGPKMHVFIEDGRVFVKRMGKQPAKYDLIMLDAFEADYIPEHMLTQEFLQEVKTVMAPGGVVAANTFSSSALYDHESVTYRAVFGPFFNLKSGNRIILGRPAGLPPMSEVNNAAMAWQAEFKRRGADPGFILTLFDTGIDWDVKARLLTDQYSPSNLLNTLPRGY
jgi:spermidine synthase